MDTRIEELSEVIIERCESYINSLDKRYHGEKIADKYRCYKAIQGNLLEVLSWLKEYRVKYKDDY